MPKSHDYLSTRRRIRQLAAMAPQGEMALEDYERAVEDGLIETDEPELFPSSETFQAAFDAFIEGE